MEKVVYRILNKKRQAYSMTFVYLAEGENRSRFNVPEMTIYWDPNMGMITNNGTEVSPATILNHEVDHAQQELYNPDQKGIDRNTPDKQYGNKEERRVITGSEQKTARALGEIKDSEVTRTDHEGQGYRTLGPTTTQRVDEIIITAPVYKKIEYEK